MSERSSLRASTGGRFAPLTGSCVACRRRNATHDHVCDECRETLAREFPEPGELPSVGDWERMLDKAGIPCPACGSDSGHVGNCFLA